MAPPLLHLRDIRQTFGHRPLLDGAELAVAPRDRIAVVGRNGSGKSTFLKIAAGLIEPDGGERWVQPGTTIRYLPQEPDFSGFKTVADYVAAGLTPACDPDAGRRILDVLGLTGDEDPARLSGGEARRAAIARTLAPEPDVLLLDEPTNHLDLPAIEWLEGELKGLRSALVIISHDRRFLSALSTATVWIDRGVARRIDRGFDGFEEWRDALLEQEELETHKLDRKLAREADWLRYGVTARRKRNQGRLRRLHALREERKVRLANRPKTMAGMSAQDASPSGKLVIEAEDISKYYGGSPVVADVSTRIARGDKIGIVGPNGAGKTTLVNMLTGVLAPDTGTIRLGTSLSVVTLDQRRESLDPTETLAHTLTDGRGDQVMVGDKPRHVVSYMQDFLFTPDQARTPVGALSGGERGRLMLARALARPSNLIVLDEPTNDLDLETLDLLQDMLADYPGTVLLVSHDRDFLDRVVTSVIVSEGNGQWREYAGGYSDIAAQRSPESQAQPTKRKSAPAPEQRAERKPERLKLTFKDQHALKTLPDEIAALESAIATLEKRIADPDFYSRDPDGFARVSADLGAKQDALEAAETEWLRLEMLREEIEAG